MFPTAHLTFLGRLLIADNGEGLGYWRDGLALRCLSSRDFGAEGSGWLANQRRRRKVTCRCALPGS